MTFTIPELAELVAALRPLTAPAPPPKDERVPRLVCDVAELRELYNTVADEVAGLHNLAAGMAERIAAQAELLAKRAEVTPAPAETKSPEPDPIAPDPIAPDPAPPEPKVETLDTKDRRAEQCKLIAGALAAAGRPLLADEIARETGLPLELVVRRLKVHGPQSLPTAPRYFTTSKEPGAYVLTNSGAELGIRP